MNIAALINKVRAKGIKLWQEDGQLKFKAPKGVWTDEIRDEVVANKGEIIAFLSKVSKTSKVPPIQPASRTDDQGNAIEAFPLSYVQEPLWFIEQLESDKAGYNLPKAVTISGELDSDQLEQAINLIIARHESLRTIFPRQGEQARQVILDSFDFKLERHDLSDLSHYDSIEKRHEKAQQLCQKEADISFDLAKGPLIRGQLYKLAEQEHILMLNMHHIITDAWSMGVFIKEFSVIMDSLRKGLRLDQIPALPPMPIQYLDYCIWQRKLLEEAQPEQGHSGKETLLERQLSYWKEKLTGVPEYLDLTTDYPRPNVKGFAGDRLDFHLDAQLTRQIKSLAGQQGCTLFMTLLAAFKSLLYRYTGQEDICLGSPIANRQYEGTESLIGMFINTLALRSQVKGDESFLALMSQVKKTCLGAYEHQDTPFDKVVEAVHPQRSLAIDPIFQIMIVLQNTPMEVPEHYIQRYPLKGEVSKFDLDIEFIETPEGLQGSIEYRTSLYKQQTIERMAQHFIGLCKAIVSTPKAAINELDFIGEAEKQQLLIAYNQTSAEYPKDKCIHELFMQQVTNNPDKIALVYQDETLSYQQLNDKSHQLALYLQSLGVKPDSLVGLCVGRSLEMIVGMMGVLQAGGAYVPLDPDYPDDRLAYMLEDSQAAIVLTQEKLKEKLSALVVKGTAQETVQDTHLIALDKQWPEISDRVADLNAKQVTLRQEVKPHHLAYMIYTSGSTGQPKGVMVEHRSLVNHNIFAGTKYQITKDDKQLLFSTMNFDLFIEEVFVILNNGAQLVIEEKDNLLTLQYFQNLIEVHNITVLNVPTAFFHQLVASDIPLGNIKNVIIGGEKLEYSKAQAFTNHYPYINLYNTYGPTETTIISTVMCVTPELINQHHAIPIGRPINNTQIYILDQNNHPVPMGVPGELHIAGDGLARGYLNRPELTDEKFVPNPFIEDTRMYKSGDLVRWLDDGNIEYLGRIDTQVKIRGFRIEMGEIETQLNQHSQIKDCVVIAHGSQGNNPESNKQLVAYYVAAAANVESYSGKEQVITLANEDLKAHLQQTLPEYMLPTAFVSLGAMPLTANGKVDRRALESMDVSLESSQVYLAPRNTTEKQLVAIWAEVLGLTSENIGLNDNFFELGGDSIKTIQIVSKAIAHHIHFDIRDMFNYQTIHELLQHCDTTKSREIVREEGTLQGPVALSPVQADFFKYTQTDVHYFNQSLLLNLNVHLSFEDLQVLSTRLVEQHDALRLRFTNDDKGWQQHYLDSTDEAVGIHVYDVSKQDEKQAADFIEQTCNHWQAELDLENGPIMRWVYFDAQSNGSDQLAIIIHHLAIDGVSWRILLEDLNQLIKLQVTHQPQQLPRKRSSYRNWVDSLATYKDSEQGQKDLAFWIEQSEKTDHATNAFIETVFKEGVFKDIAFIESELVEKSYLNQGYRNQDIGHTKVQLSKANTEKLLKHCHQAYGTDINDLLLTAVILSYYQATGNQTLMLDLEGHGREQLDPAIDITNTLGWFTSIYPVNFELSSPQDIGQSIKEIKTALHAIPNKGIGYSIFRYIDQHEAIKNIPEAPIVFNFLGDFQSSDKESTDNYFTFSDSTSGKTSSPQQEVSKLVTINGMVVFDQLSFSFNYPEEWQGQPISLWQTHFISALEELIEHCSDAPKMGYTPSDFPLLTASLPQLDKIMPNLELQRHIQLDNIQDIYPLTPLQSGILFETLYAQTEDNKGMYLTQSAIGINGEVDINALQQAWQLIVDHYDALRMMVVTDNDRANTGNSNAGIQVILKHVDIQVNQVDWSEKTDPELKSACEQWMQKSKRSGIRLEQTPLMRVNLFQGQDSCYLLIEQHHIVMDGWSQSIVLANLFKLYQALVNQQDYQLPPSASYSAYVQVLLNRNQEEEALYWKDYLSQYEEKTPLPMELSAQQINSIASQAREVFDRSGFSLSAESTVKLEQLVKDHRLTINTVLQFIWGLLLHLHSGNKAVTFGSVSSGRSGILDIQHSDQMVGLCINTTPTCIQFDGELSLLAQLKQLQSRESEKLHYETTPLTYIQEILGHHSATGINTNEDFFQTLFVYENYPVETIAETNGLIVDFIGDEAPNYPLTVVGASQETLSISFIWDGFYYNEKAITTLMTQFERLALQFIDAPEASLKDVGLISAQEKQRLLTDYNQTQVNYSQDKCIHQLFIEQVAINPDKIAIADQDELLTYQQLYDKSHALALYLQNLDGGQGVKPDTLVGLCVERSLEMMVGMLGILQAGGAYVPMDPDYPEDRLAYMLQDSQAAIVLTQENLKGKLRALTVQETQFIVLDEQWSEISDGVADLNAKQVTLQQEVTSHNLAYVIYTSGSTGQPKGVMVEHKSLHALCVWHKNEFNVTASTKATQVANIAFDASVWEIWPYLINSASLFIVSNDTYIDIVKLNRFLNDNKVTHCFLATPVAQQLLQLDELNNPYLQYLLIGGDKLSKYEDKDYPFTIVNNYGPTESTVVATSAPIKGSFSIQKIGRPISNTQTYILDQYNNPVPMGVSGELHIAGDGLARGYLNRPELTEEKFIPNPFNTNANNHGTRMYKSGDLVRWLDDGSIEYLGRIDTQVKIRGYRIEMGEIETQLNQYPQIKDSVVIAQGQDGNKQLVAYYVSRDTGEEQVIHLANEDLKAHLQQTLPEYMLPAAFVSLEAMPLTPNGKVDRRALESMDVSLESSQAYVAPRNVTEKQLVAIWADILNLEPNTVGINDNFFELGGDSIKTIQIVSKAIAHHIHFDIRDMFNHQTIHELLQHCDTTKSREITKEEGGLQGAVDLSPVQSYFFEHTQTDVHHFNQSVLLNLNVHLSIEDLQALSLRIVEQHDALRLRFTKNDHGWQQRYSDLVGSSSEMISPEMLGIHTYDIAELHESRNESGDGKQVAEYVEAICNQWQAGLDLENGPIMRWVYFDAQNNGSDQLAIIIHHLAIDGVSWRILLEDLSQLIKQQLTSKLTPQSTEQPLQLSSKRSSYRNWVDSLATYKDSEQGRKDLAFWIEQSEKTEHVTNAFKESALVEKDYLNQGYLNKDILHTDVHLSKANTEKLLRHCHQAYGTDINDLLLTAVMLSYHQATGNQTLMLDLEGHGREQLDPAIDITNTLGWFTSIYPVSFELSNPQNIGQSIKEIKAALHAIPNKGVGYSIFRYIDQHETIKNIPEAGVLFNFLGDFQSNDKESTEDYFTFSENPSGNASSKLKEVNKLVSINGMVVFDRLSFTFSYPEEWLGQPVSHWQTHFILVLETLIEHCYDAPRQGYTPDDFPMLTASLPQLDLVVLDLEQQRHILLDNIQDIYPLTPLQSGILFETLLAQTEDNKGMYLTQSAIGINGKVDINALRQAWQLIVDHYDALRMLVITDDVAGIDAGVQVILKHVDLQVNWVDWSEKTDTELKSACEQWMQDSKRSGISLEMAPLMRVHLLQGKTSSYMLFEQHHIVLDGWSQSIVLANLFKLYQALVHQREYQLPPSAPYGAYVQVLLNRNQEEEALYWKDYLSHHEEKTPLPMEHLSPQGNSSIERQAREVFNEVSLCLSEENSARLNQLVKDHRLTMNTVLQFVWGLLLHLHSGNKAVTFGSVSSGRSGILDIQHSDQIVGLCINTTPTCIQFDAELSLLAQLKQMQSRESEKLHYETTPLTHIQEILAQNTSTGFSTNEDFFQTLFVYENYPVERISEANSLIRDVISEDTPNYPLTITGASGKEIEVSFTWDNYYYDENTITDLMAQFERLMQQLITTPEASLKDVGFISAQEKQQLLIDCNQTQTDYPQDTCIHQLFMEQVAVTPDKIAVVYQDESLTYQQLYDKSQALALYLQNLGVGQGVKPDSLVGLCMERSLEMIVGILGILQAGGAYVPMAPDYPEERLTYMLGDCQAAIVLTQGSLKDKLRALTVQETQFMALDAQWAEISDGAAELKSKQIKIQQEVKSHHLAYVIYTSGSTGQPKGVMVEHKGVTNTVNWFVNNFKINEKSKLIQLTDYTFDPSVEDIFGTLSTGATLYIPTPDLLLDESNLVGYIREKEISGLNFVPGILKGLLCDYDKLDSIDFVISGGERLDERAKDAILDKGYSLYNNYGPTEITIDALSSKCTEHPVVIGNPIANIQIYILDQYHNPVPMGVPGELHIAGDGLARGYLNRPELTDDKFIVNPFKTNSSNPDSTNSDTRMYKSGDLVRWVTNTAGQSEIEYLGRIDTQVKIRGYRVETGEIEAQLNQHPEIKDSVVIVHSPQEAHLQETTQGNDQQGNKSLIAYYVANNTNKEHVVNLANQELKAHLQQSLPEYMLPTAFVSLEAIPLTHNGKVDRRALESMDVSLESSQAYIAPRNEIEKQLVAIWAEVLKLAPEKIGVNDNFFELGGHSLLATQVISKIRSQLNTDVPMKALFSASTLAEVSEVTQAIKVQHEKPSLDADLTDVEFEETSL